jgi:hypothetical protein
MRPSIITLNNNNEQDLNKENANALERSLSQHLNEGRKRNTVRRRDCVLGEGYNNT